MNDAHDALSRLGWSDKLIAAFLNAPAFDQVVSLGDSDVSLESFDVTDLEIPIDSPITATRETVLIPD